METRRRDDSREATIRLQRGVALRRRGEAEELEAICDLAVAYRLDEADLLDYGTEIYRDRDTKLPEKLIHPGGEGTPSVSEFLAMEVAALLRCSQTAAIETIASALNLKYRHPMLFEAVLNGEVERWLAAKAAWLCRDLDPMRAETGHGPLAAEAVRPGAQRRAGGAEEADHPRRCGRRQGTGG